jgi:hypothetical protein
LLLNKKLYIIVEYNKRVNDYNFYMNDFWNNISRYPRFFISSLAGLILIILTPFQNLFKIKKFRFVLVIFFLLFIIILYNIIVNMIGL